MTRGSRILTATAEPPSPVLAAEHSVQLFDDEQSQARGVAQFVRDGLEQNETVLLVIVTARQPLLESQLRAGGMSLEEQIAAGRVHLCDAAETLGRIVHRGSPAADRFERVIASLVRRLAAGARAVRIYGEMVDVLAERGDFGGARQLEELWCGLQRRLPFTLLCGYSAVNFGDPRSSSALADICRHHSSVRQDPDDVLSRYLVGSSESSSAGVAGPR